MGLTAYQLHFPYTCPKVSLSDEAVERPFNLLCVPISSLLETPVSKATIMSFLTFIFHDCYGDLYEKNDPQFLIHQKHLADSLEYHNKNMPDFVSAS